MTRATKAIKREEESPDVNQHMQALRPLVSSAERFVNHELTPLTIRPITTRSQSPAAWTRAPVIQNRLSISPDYVVLAYNE